MNIEQHDATPPPEEGSIRRFPLLPLLVAYNAGILVAVYYLGERFDRFKRLDELWFFAVWWLVWLAALVGLQIYLERGPQWHKRAIAIGATLVGGPHFIFSLLLVPLLGLAFTQPANKSQKWPILPHVILIWNSAATLLYLAATWNSYDFISPIAVIVCVIAAAGASALCLLTWMRCQLTAAPLLSFLCYPTAILISILSKITIS